MSEGRKVLIRPSLNFPYWYYERMTGPSEELVALLFFKEKCRTATLASLGIETSTFI